MSITTCQKVTLISCSVLCVSLFLPRMLLPRAREDAVQTEVGPGFYPPMRRQAPLSQDPEQWGLDSRHSLSHHTEIVAEVKGIGRKNNLMAQVIPIYGFGILLYILYIMYKLTCKEKPPKSAESTAPYKAQLDYTQLNEYQLAKLQRRLLQTEQMMEMIASGKSRGAGSKNKRSKKEEKLLRHLRQITELMQEGRLEGASPEREAEEVPYFAGWEGYPEETFPEYEEELRYRMRCKIVPLVATLSQPTAEALAERMEQEEEDVGPRKLEVLHEEDEEEEEEEKEEEEEEETEDIAKKEDEEEEVEEEDEDERSSLLSPPSPMLTSEKKEFLGLEMSTELRSHSPGKKITFSDHRDVFRYPREDACEEDKGQEEEPEEEEEEEDESEPEEEVPEAGEEPEADEEDPVTEAESLLFSCDVWTNPEREAEEETGGALTGAGEDLVPAKDHVPESEHWAVSGLRMRNRRDT
ncbi:protein RIC-3 isoform X2 [Eucyclogobius newberryi]|uniref:protein RIC-3 isoform X2 n=1 Tax=Eucyclogobius newberryi TaxID=166745 RepID=UPI003B5A7071